MNTKMILYTLAAASVAGNALTLYVSFTTHRELNACAKAAWVYACEMVPQPAKPEPEDKPEPEVRIEYRPAEILPPPSGKTTPTTF